MNTDEEKKVALREYQRAWRLKNKERVSGYCRKWESSPKGQETISAYRSNPEIRAKRAKAESDRRKANPEKYRAIMRRCKLKSSLASFKKYKDEIYSGIV